MGWTPIYLRGLLLVSLPACGMRARSPTPIHPSRMGASAHIYTAEKYIWESTNETRPAIPGGVECRGAFKIPADATRRRYFHLRRVGVRGLYLHGHGHGRSRLPPQTEVPVANRHRDGNRRVGAPEIGHPTPVLWHVAYAAVVRADMETPTRRRGLGLCWPLSSWAGVHGGAVLLSKGTCTWRCPR